VTIPAPLHLPVLWTELGQAEKEAALNEAAKGVRQSTPTGQRVVLMQALCIKVPAGFCDKAGLKANGGGEQPAASAWTLTHREAKMFGALLRSESSKEVLSCPQIATLDRQEASVEVGQSVPVAKADDKDGPIQKVSAIEECNVGVRLRVNPEVSTDGRHVRLKVTAKCSCLEDVSSPPAVQNAEGVVMVPSGGTAVFMAPAGATHAASGKKPCELLWVLTAHVVEGRGQPAAKEGAGPKPVAPSGSPKQ
jgi:general secretion pathway protein D